MSFLEPQNVALFGNRVFIDIIELKWGHWGALIQYDWCPNTKRKIRFGNRPTGRTSCDNRGRGENEAVPSQGVPRINGLHCRLGRGKGDSPLRASEAARPFWHLNVGWLSSTTGDSKSLLFTSHRVCSMLLRQPLEINTSNYIGKFIVSLTCILSVFHWGKYHNIYPFKVYNLFFIYSQDCPANTTSLENLLLSPKKDPIPVRKVVPKSPVPQPLQMQTFLHGFAYSALLIFSTSFSHVPAPPPLFVFYNYLCHSHPH